MTVQIVATVLFLIALLFLAAAISGTAVLLAFLSMAATAVLLTLLETRP